MPHCISLESGVLDKPQVAAVSVAFGNNRIVQEEMSGSGSLRLTAARRLTAEWLLTPRGVVSHRFHPLGPLAPIVSENVLQVHRVPVLEQ